jgi:integrase
VTFGEYARQWHESRKASGNYAASTMELDKYNLNHLLTYFENVPLKEIDAATVRKLYNSFANDLSGYPANKSAIMLHQIMKQAMDDDIILRNPCERVPKPKVAKAGKQQSPIDLGTARRLASQLNRALAEDEAHRDNRQRSETHKRASALSRITAVRVALATGLRRGEILGLTWGCLSVDDGLVQVRKSLCTETGELKEPKTTNSIRDVAIDRQTALEIARWKKIQAEYLLGFGIAQNASTPVITNEVGGFMDGRKMDAWWREFRKRQGFDGLRFHDLRHVHATLLVSSGLNIKAVSKRLGHSSVAITLDLYSHAQREDDEKAAEIIGGILAETPDYGKVVAL